MGSFTLRPFIGYKDMHGFVKVNAPSHCHKMSTASAKKMFIIYVQLVSAHEKVIQDHKKIVASIIDTNSMDPQFATKKQ